MRRAAALAALLAALSAAAARADACDPAEARLLLPGGEVIALQVELADTPGERAAGLMDRATLPEGTGMLFLYPAPQKVAFWMKNTLIPLDMLFFDGAGRLAHLHEAARPLDETPIPGAAPDDADPLRRAVLEIGGGEAARLGIAPGASLDHAALRPECGLPPAR